MRSRPRYVVGSVAAAGREPRPRAAAVARRLRAEIDPKGWVAGELERWYATGWSVEFRRGEGALELVVARADEEGVELAVQVAPARLPGPIGRALGRAASATPEDVLELARAAHAVLSSDRRLTRLRWRWNRYPDEQHSTGEPTAPAKQAPRRRGGGRRAR